MKFKWIRSNISNIKFIVSLGLIALVIGFILFQNESTDIKSGVVSTINELTLNINNTNQNSIIFHLAILSIISLLSLIIIGFPIAVIYYFYEFVSIGYLLSALFEFKKITGLLFGSIFIIINKILFLSVLSYFLINMINYTKKYLKSIKTSKKELIINYLYKCFFVLIIVFINDIILYFIGNKLTNIFTFLLK